MKFPMHKYHFHIAVKKNNKKPYKVIATSTFAGKTVRGIATCSEEDTFDLAKGQRLAALRCAAKVADMRNKRAFKKYEDAHIAMVKAQNEFNKAKEYCLDAMEERQSAHQELEDFYNSL